MADRYPAMPGAKGPDGTSQDAAKAVAPPVSHLRRLAMRSLARLGRQPRRGHGNYPAPLGNRSSRAFSELRAMSPIESNGARRRNPSGKSASELRLEAARLGK